MKHLAIIALLAALPLLVLSQGLSDAELNAELDKMYQASKAQPQAAASMNAQQPAVQVNVQTQNEAQSASAAAATAVQKQPTTVIEAAPLTESRAERIRKARQETELLTEQRIVEKLEQSRIEDEKRRAEVLFGDKFNQINNPVPAPTPAPVVVAPVAAPVPVVVQEAVVPAPSMSKEDVRGEVRAALEDMKEKEEKKPEKKSYFTLSGGMGDYPDVVNVRGNYNLAMAFGQKVNDRLLIEGSFSYANYDLQQRDSYTYYGYNCYGYGYDCYPRITNLNQYALGATLKYQILPGMFRPIVGGSVQYTYRTYADTQFAISNNEANSHALDMGVLAGAEVEATESLAIGLEFRYLWNLTYRPSNNGLVRSISKSLGNSYEKPLETLGQTQINLFTRMTF